MTIGTMDRIKLYRKIVKDPENINIFFWDFKKTTIRHLWNHFSKRLEKRMSDDLE